MPSATSNTQLRIRFFLKVATLLLYAKFKKIDLLPICFYRSAEEQAKRYAQGRTAINSWTSPGRIVTYIDGVTYHSKHERWRAIDFVIVKLGKLIWHRTLEYDKLGKFWKRIGGRWGGDFFRPNGKPMNDVGHFED